MKHSAVSRADGGGPDLVGHGRPAFCQSTVTDIVSFLVTNQSIPTGDEAAIARRPRRPATRSRARSIVNLTSVPIATSSSGFLYRLNPQLGTVERATQSFGGFFVERAFAPGNGRASFGLSASTSSFDRLDDQDLRDGTFLTTASRFAGRAGAVRDRDADAARAEQHDDRVRERRHHRSIRDRRRAAVRAARGRRAARQRLSRRDVPAGERIGDRHAASPTPRSARNTRWLPAHDGGAAVAAELRLPTGNEANLLGAGKAGFRLFGIGALERGPLMLSGNAGIVRGGVSDELNAGRRGRGAVHPRLSLTAEFLSRQIDELRPLCGLLAAASDQTRRADDQADADEAWRTVAAGITGFKWNPRRYAGDRRQRAVELHDRRLTAPITPTVAFEYGF